MDLDKLFEVLAHGFIPSWSIGINAEVISNKEISYGMQFMIQSDEGETCQVNLYKSKKAVRIVLQGKETPFLELVKKAIPSGEITEELLMNWKYVIEDNEDRWITVEEPSVIPMYTHDCDQCIFLGNDILKSQEIVHLPVDVYVCHQGNASPTIILRCGNEGADYISWNFLFFQEDLMNSHDESSSFCLARDYYKQAHEAIQTEQEQLNQLVTSFIKEK
jgi:hypothetical protein